MDNLGIWLRDGSELVSLGTPSQRNYLVYYGLVQEQPTNLWHTNTAVAQSLPIVPKPSGSSANPSIFLRFTTICAPTGETNLLNTADHGVTGQVISGLTLRDCEIYGAGANWRMNESNNTPVVGLTNNVFHRVPFAISNNATITCFNNLFYGTTNTNGFTVSIRHRSGTSHNTNENNVFDGVTASLDGLVGYNAYLNGATNKTIQTNDITNNLTWQAGPLGAYYQAADSPLLNNGSTSATNLGLYHYTVLTNNLIEGTNIVSRGYHYIALDSTGEPIDTTDDGLPDYVKDSNGDGVYDSGDLANWLSPFNIYDQGTTYLGWTPQNMRLGYWKFDTAALTNQAGVAWTTNNGCTQVPDWSGYAVSQTAASGVLAYPLTSNGTNYLNLANGTVRFWYQPDWSSTQPSEPQYVVFLSAGSDTNCWQLWETVFGSNTYFSFTTESNECTQMYGFNFGGLNGEPVTFQSNLWYQIALTYSPTNVALYTNGVLLSTVNYPQALLTNTPGGGWYEPLFDFGEGNVFYPSANQLASFCIGYGFNGNYAFGSYPLMGQLDELETFNYAMTAQQVAAGFPTFGGNATNMLDTYCVGRSDMLQSYVDGVFPPSSNTAAPCRLGYWRFDTLELVSEQGQIPKSQSGVTLVPSWSGTVANIGSSAGSQLTYCDVGSNGWANINCHQGSLRFWFKPNWNSGGGPGHNAPFVYMGTTNGSDEWALWLNSSGNLISFITASNTGATNTDLTASCGPTSSGNSMSFTPASSWGTTNTNLTASCSLTKTNWAQIVLTYGSNGSSLYINGSLATTGSHVSYWPSLANRNLGMVIGNNTAYNASINGQFEEMETFNYQLAPGDIAANFQIVASVDSDLNGIPDLLEDIRLSKARPFLGTPVVITGTIEAEQFDMGGPGVGYNHSGASNPPSSYRPTGLYITSCNDLGGGYCLDQTQTGDWAQYTINVLVPQTYMVEVRAEAIGTNTGGVFQCDFTNGIGVVTNGGFSNSTGPLTITTNTWTNFTNVVYLPTNATIMTLHCLTDAPGTSNVGRFNYISIYPWWQAGFTSTYTNTNLMSGVLSTSNDYADALANASAIQSAIGQLHSTGGTVLLPGGTYYVAQAFPNELSDACANTAVSIVTNNVEIKGAGKTDTTLVAYNRATTVFCLGRDAHTNSFQCVNFILRDMTIEGQPHSAVCSIVGTNITYITGTNIIYDPGELNPNSTNDLVAGVTNGLDTGAPTIFYGPQSTQYTYNILITNCQFLYGYNSITIQNTFVSNVLVRACDFNMWGGSNTNFGNVGFFGMGFNFVVIENTFNGNTNLAPASFGDVSTNMYYNGWIAPSGFVWFQIGGNFFVARNAISNYSLEGVQVNLGPNSIVGNTYSTMVNNFSACALDALGAWAGYGPTGTSQDEATCFIGNSVYGGRSALEGAGGNVPYTINCSGNSATLYPAYNEVNQPPAAAAGINLCQSASVCGNTLVTGGYGFFFSRSNGGALLLNNNFGGATYRGIGHETGIDTLTNAQVFGNTLGEGVSFHAQLPYANTFGWFFRQNTYVNALSNSVAPFFDPASSAVHLCN